MFAVPTTSRGANTPVETHVAVMSEPMVLGATSFQRASDHFSIGGCALQRLPELVRVFVRWEDL